MANPRQRRKARSSSHRPVSHSKHAKRRLKRTPTIRGPKALQDAWDNTKTVRQNYSRLGLAATLDPSTRGGVEPSLDNTHALTTPVVDPLKNDLPSGFGRIIRDAAGGIVDVELDESQAQLDIEEDVDHVDAGIDPEARRQWVTQFTKKDIGGKSNNDLISELKRMSASTSVRSRHLSGGQLKFLEALVKKHGRNVKAMAGDLRLNPEQKTIGQVRRALKAAGFSSVDSESMD